MDVKMWIKAIQVMPRLTKEEWDRLDFVAKWLVAVRFAAVILSIIAPAIAGLLAARDGMFSWWRWGLLTIGLVFAHGANNLINDWTDYRKGVDRDNYFRTQYGPQPLESGIMTEKTLFKYIIITGLIAIAAGIPLVILRGLPALILMLVGALFVLFYTWPLKYIGLGELTVLLVWGPLMIAGGYFVITGVWDWNVVIASLPFGLGSTSVIFGKHIDKLDADKAKGIHTVPVLIGEKAARIVALCMMALQFISVIYLVVIGYFAWPMLIVLATLFWFKPVWGIYTHPRPTEPPADAPENMWPLWFVAASFYQNRIFGMLLIVGLIIQLFIH